MNESIERILAAALWDIQSAASAADVEAIRVRALGKKGELTALLRAMGSLDAAERPRVGQLVNQARGEIEQALAQRALALEAAEKQARLAVEALDITAPGKKPAAGSLHPLFETQRLLEDIFIGMGFEIAEGPEIERDLYNFKMLNTPDDHPARDMHDSFYISEQTLLRTHTSPVQARYMLANKPPIRIVCPGRVYRVDEVDARHSPVFHQMEGLVVDHGIRMSDLKGVLDEFARQLFGQGAHTRFRPSYFPFTEPSAEVDVSCTVCGGTGCRTCGNAGWLEILGCGMVHPNVLEAAGIDSREYTGFAFGMGIDRIAMLRFGITDMRALFENDIRFLEQF